MARNYDPTVPSEFDAIIEQAAKANGLPPDLFRKQIWAESDFNPRTVSKAQAKGLAQFITSTGKYYGLKTDEDFLDPAKSVNAGAQYMADLMRTYGDWNTALVAYNGGTKAAKAYQRGEMDKLPSETQGYVKLLGSTDPKKSDVMSLNSFENPARLEATSVYANLAEGDVNLQLADTSASIVTGQQDAAGFVGGIVHGATGTFVRQRMASSDPFDIGGSYVPSDEESVDILRQVDYDTTAYNSIVRGLPNPDDIKSRIDIYKQNREYEQTVDKSGIFSSLTSGLGEAVVDPLNWAGAGATGGFGVVGRVVVGGALGNVLSGQLRESVTGIESNIYTDAASGAMFAGLIEGAARVIPKATHYVGDTARRADIIREAAKTGKDVDPAIMEGIGGSKGLAARLNNFRDWSEAHLPNWTAGETLFTSKNPVVREFADKLFRRERGTKVQLEDGSFVNVEVGASRTVSEIVEQGEKDLFKWSSRYDDAYTKLLAEGHTEEAIERAIYLRNEGKTVEGMDTKLIDEIVADARALFDQQGDKLVANGFIKERYKNYLPVSMDERKAADLIASLGGGKKGLDLAHSLLRESLIRGADDPAVRTRLMKFWENKFADDIKKLTEEVADKKKLTTTKKKMFDTWLKKQANDDAFGYIDQSKSSSGLFNDREGTLRYDHERTPWDTSYEVRLPNGSTISPNGLRRNFYDTTSSYIRRTNGDLAFDSVGLHGWDEVAEKVSQMSREVELSEGLGKTTDTTKRALKQSVKMMYGMSPVEDSRGLNSLHAIAESLRNLAMFTKGGYMGLMNYTEIAEGIKAYGGSFLIKSIPGASKLFGNWTRGGMSDVDVRAVQNMVFGDEIRQLDLWRNIKRSNLHRYNGNKFLAGVVSGTQWVSSASPLTKFLQVSQRNIVGEAQGQFLAEMTRSAHGLAKTKRGFFNKVDLQRNSISPKRAEAMLDAVRKATTVGKDGSLKVTNSDALFNDPSVLADIRRMGDYVANNVIQRNAPADAFLWADKNNPVLQLAMQFKTFALRSYNKRLAKMMNRVEDEGAMSQMHSMMISGALATLGHVGITSLRTMGMNEEDRTKYLQRNLGIDSLEDIASGEALMTAAYNGGLLRNGVLSAPVLAANLVGLGNPSGKTTVSTAYGNEKDTTASFNAGSWLENMFPSMGVGESIVNTGLSGFDYLRDKMGITEFTSRDQEKIQKSFHRSVKGITPNWPLFQNYFLEMIKE